MKEALMLAVEEDIKMGAMIKSIWVCLVLTMLFGFSTEAQDAPYFGGSGDGHTNSEYVNANSFIYIGGQGDGFTISSSYNSFNDTYKGGQGDGFTSEFFNDTFLDFTKGGQGDGYSNNEYNLAFNDSYKGGSSDGFGYGKFGHTVYWTGLVGTGWNVEENWEYNIIPDYCNPVVIPSDVPNFPFVNSGVLRIGYHNNEGDYLCKKLKINLGAEITTRVNCFVENYNTVFVRGKFIVKNTAANAFVNSTNGIIEIKPAGAMILRE